MTSVMKGNFETQKKVQVENEVPKDDLEARFEKEAMKRLGGSIAFVAKKKIKWTTPEE
jgi:hypothetical protein